MRDDKFTVVLSLPMRNWNKRIRIKEGLHAHSSQPTYEELKPRESASCSREACSSQPTYEELKRWYHKSLALSILVLSLPMRNWNEDTRDAIAEVIACSQPTYEELKHLQCRSVGTYLDGSQPTYEELILNALENGSLPNSSSQPTYEELKPFLNFGGTSNVLGSQPTYEELKP